MAESKTVTVVPLNSKNYSTWKIQCKMALMKEGLWRIVNGTEVAPTEAQKGHLFRRFQLRAALTSHLQLRAVFTSHFQTQTLLASNTLHF